MKKGNITVNHKLCKLCGICVSFCPVKNITIKNQKLVENGMCTACRICEQRCPDFAITVELTNGQETITR